MEHLIQKSRKKSDWVRGKERRYIYDLIDWHQKLIVILGYRGIGKTTLLLQYLSDSAKKGIYLSLDDFYFESNRLVSAVEELYHLGYRVFLLDEVHKNAWWSKDVKQLYDDYENIQIVAPGSSILDISKSKIDLSRRATLYSMKGLSFREYLNFEKKTNLPTIALPEVIEKHHKLGPDLLDIFSFPDDFHNFLKFGYFPFYLEGQNSYFQKLEETLKLVIETDIAPYEQLQHTTVGIMKKLLFVLSESVPFTPNIKKLSEKIGIPRNTLLRLLDYLEQAHILHLLRRDTKGLSYLQKPNKIYLGNTNFIYMFSEQQANLGNIRETFFFNQLSASHTLTFPKFGDFMVDNNIVFEIGGPSKTMTQVKGVPNAYLALDIKGGSQKRIPLWLFGFLY
jgi:hypothetical protein